MDQLSDHEIITRLGGPTAIARMCDITPQAVSIWRRNGMPRLRRQLLLLMRPDIFADQQEAAGAEQHDKAAA